MFAVDDSNAVKQDIKASDYFIFNNNMLNGNFSTFNVISGILIQIITGVIFIYIGVIICPGITSKRVNTDNRRPGENKSQFTVETISSDKKPLYTINHNTFSKNIVVGKILVRVAILRNSGINLVFRYFLQIWFIFFSLASRERKGEKEQKKPNGSDLVWNFFYFFRIESDNLFNPNNS